MLLRKIIIGGAIFSMLGVASFYAAPAKKMSTVRAGQLEAEYRKAIQPRKDQIIQELTAAGFGHIAQQIIKRYEPTKQQEKQKPTQAAAVPPIVPPAPEKQLLQQEKDLLEQRKRDFLQYKQQLEQLEREIGDVVSSAKMVSEVDAMYKKIDALQALQQTLNADASDIKKLRETLAQKKQLFLKKQGQERAEVEAKVSKAIENVKKAESLDQINQALSELNGEKLHAVLSKLESEDQKIYQERLNKEVALLEEKKQDLLQNQTEQERAEQARKAQEEIAKDKAVKDAAFQAEQEEQKRQALELKKKKDNLIQEIESVIKQAEKAKTMQQVEESMSAILEYIGLRGEPLTRGVLTENEKKGLEDRLRVAMGKVRDKQYELLKKTVELKIEVIKSNMKKGLKAESSIRSILDQIAALEEEIRRSEIGTERSKPWTTQLDALKKDLETNMQSIKNERKREFENEQKARTEKLEQEKKAREEALRIEQEKKKSIEKVRKDISEAVKSIEQKSINAHSISMINNLLKELEATNKKISESEQKFSITIDQREKEKLASIKQTLQAKGEELEKQEKAKAAQKTEDDLKKKRWEKKQKEMEAWEAKVIQEINKNLTVDQLEKLKQEISTWAAGFNNDSSSTSPSKDWTQRNEINGRVNSLYRQVDAKIEGLETAAETLKKQQQAEQEKAKKEKEAREEEQRYKDFVKRRDDLFKKYDEVKDLDESKKLLQEIKKLEAEISASNLIEQSKIEVKKGFHDTLTLLTSRIAILEEQKEKQREEQESFMDRLFN